MTPETHWLSVEDAQEWLRRARESKGSVGVDLSVLGKLGLQRCECCDSMILFAGGIQVKGHGPITNAEELRREIVRAEAGVAKQ
jgi:hypothetical protein